MYVFVCSGESMAASSVVTCGWRAWGDTTGGPFGQKAAVTMGQSSSTSDGYEVGQSEPDLILDDMELEQLHLCATPYGNQRTAE